MARSRLSIGDLVTLVGGTLLLLSIFMPWYKAPAGLGGSGASDSLVDVSGTIAFLLMGLVVVVISLILLRLLDIFYLKDQGVSESLVMVILAAMAAAAVWFRFLAVPDAVGFTEINRHWGMWFGVIASATFLLGTVIKFVEERLGRSA